MSRGRKGKYEESRIRRIEQIIARTGQESAAIEAVDISSTTFYRWKREKREFRERVERAKQEFYDTNDEEIIRTFRESLIEALKGPTQEWEEKEITELPNGDKVRKVKTKTVQKGPAQWAMKIAAPVVDGAYGREEKDVTSDGEKVQNVNIDFSELSDRQLRRIANGEPVEDVI